MNTTTEAKRIVQSILNQRKRLIDTGKSFKDKATCFKIIRQIQTYIDAHGNRYTLEQWKKLIVNNYNDLLFLIPNNKAGLSIKFKLMELVR